MNLVITLVMYILVLTFVQGFRWNSAKDFFMQQENSEQEYKKSLEQKNAALELAVQRETKANLAKREFLFNMSHDIRTPMNAIIGFTALAQTHIDDRDQVEDYLKKISVSSQHLLSLINDVLDMAAVVCVVGAVLICRAKKKKLSKKSTVVIGIAAFIIAIVAVIEIARIPMPL